MKFKICKRARFVREWFRKGRKKFSFYVLYTKKSEFFSATQRCFSFFDAMIISLLIQDFVKLT